MYLSDRNRVEILLPPQMMLAVIEAGVEDKTDIKYASIVRHCLAAGNEATNDLKPKDQKKIVFRCTRLHLEVTEPYRGENEEVAKVGLINFYVMKAIVDSGYLRYDPGSSLDNAFQLFIEAIEPHAQIELKDKSAQKQARKVLAHLQRLGYYRGVEALPESQD